METQGGPPGLTTARIEALSDSIFAFAMTLLVLDLHVPEIAAELVHGRLGPNLLELWPKALSFVTSFLILGVGWVGQHTAFHYIRRSDRPFLWINILYLMGVAFVPFSTSLMGKYGHEQLAIFVFGTNLFFIAALLYFAWWYATHNHRLVDHHLDPEIIRLVKQRISGAILMYFVILGISFWNTHVSRLLFLVGPLSFVRPSRLDRYFK